MEPQPNINQPLWQIISVQDTTEWSPGQGAYPAKRISFRLPDGTESSVTVADKDLTPENVAHLVHEMAMRLHHIGTMQGPPVGEAVYGTQLES